MSVKWAARWEKFLGLVKYLLAVFMILAGIATAISDLMPLGDGTLGYIYTHRWALVSLGTIFTASGLALLYGKITRSRHWIGYGLLSIFACFLFAFILNTGSSQGFDWGNAMAAVVVGALFLRWRFKTSYINPNHFVDRHGNLR